MNAINTTPGGRLDDHELRIKRLEQTVGGSEYYDLYRAAKVAWAEFFADARPQLGAAKYAFSELKQTILAVEEATGWGQ